MIEKIKKDLVFCISMVLCLIICVWSVGFSESFTVVADNTLAFLTHNFGWLYLLSVGIFVMFTFYMALGKFGHIRLGKDDDRPEYSTLSWFAMLFGAGMGVGLVFYGIAEPVSHFMNPIPGVEAMTREAADFAIKASFVHWGIHPWSCFAVVGLAIAYFQFRKGKPGLMSSVLDSFKGKNSALRTAFDAIAAFATVAGVVTSLGLGVMQINSATSVKVDDLQNPWLWHCRCDDGLNVLILGKAVMDDYTAKNGSLEGLKVGIVCANDETGTSAAASYMEYFEKQGVEYYVDYHNKDDADLSAYIQKAIGEGCNAWVSSTHDIAAAALAKAMYEAGLREQIVYMNPILAQSAVLDLMEPEWVEGWGCACDYSATDTRELPAKFTEAWYNEYGKSIIPDVTGALYYNHTHVLLHAIEQAKSADPAKIRDAVAAINGLETLAGTVYSDEYTNMLYEIGIAKIFDLVPTMVGSVSMAEDYGFGG